MNWQQTVMNLLAKAQDAAATEEERKTYTERATYLMAKYGVEALLDRPKNVPLDIHAVVFKVPNPYAKTRASLIYRIAKALGLRTVRNVRADTVHVFGLPRDIESFSMLYASLWVQALLSLASAQQHKPAGEHGKTFNHSYLLGFIDEVSARVSAAARRANRDTANSTPGTDLVLANRNAAIDLKVAEIFPTLRKGAASRANSNSGYQSGVNAGARADINQPRMGGSHTSRPSLT